MKKHSEKERDRVHHLLGKETTIIIAIIIISQDVKMIIDRREDIITRLRLTNKKRDSIIPPKRVDKMIPNIVIKKSLRKRHCH